MTSRGGWSLFMWMDRQSPEGKARVVVRSWGRCKIGLYILSLELEGLCSCQSCVLRQRLTSRAAEDTAVRHLSGRARKG